MDLLRRLFGINSETADKTANNNKMSPGQTTPLKAGTSDITTAVNTANMAASTVPSKPKLSTQEINEAAVTDPTPIFGATRPLPPLESAVKPGKHIVHGQATDIGMVRSNNQDSVYTLLGSLSSVEGHPDFGLFIVADGMGGHHDGERASAIAVRTIAKHMTEKFYLPMLHTLANDEEKPIISEVLSQAVQKANDAVAGEIPEGGTTVTAAALVGDLLYIAHVGDSRAYLIGQSEIEQLTRDHSLVQRLIELDQLTHEEAAVHPQRNVLYRAIGQSENLEVDVTTRRLQAGARLMLCSDGVWNQVSESILLQSVQTSKSAQDACDHLIMIANDRGRADNITVILDQ